jgi:hypothetical protein
MKPIFYLLPVFISCFNNVKGQNNIPEFGKVSTDELKMSECSFEKGAGAMNLIKTAKITFGISGFSGAPKLNTEYRVRIKIFNEREFKAANVRIPYTSKSRSSRITDVDAFIYYLDSLGKIVKEKVAKKEVFNENTKAKNAVNYMAFTFPDLKNGCVIEYRYTRVDKNSFRVEPWFFQDLLPTGVSPVEAVIPAYLNMNYHILVSDSIERDSSEKKYYRSVYDEEKRGYTMRNIRSFRIEPMMSSLKDNLQRVEFTLLPSNSLVSFFIANTKLTFYNRMLLEAPFFGHQYKKNIESTTAFIDSLKKLVSSEAKIAAAYYYVRRNIEWNNELTFFCDSLEECLKNRSGSNADMNLLFVNLLRKAGVTCYPLLISTRENGNPDPTFESLSQFNGVDVFIYRDSSTYYVVDCTQKNLSYKIPPYNILNSNTYLIDEKSNGWVSVTDPRILMESNTFVYALMDERGIVKGNMNISLVGFAKTETLAEMKRRKDKDEEANDLANNPEDLLVDSALMLHEKEDNDTLAQQVIFHFVPANTDKVYFLNPFMFSSFKKNPFRDSVRYTDIDFGCNQSYSEKIQVHIPDNFSIESLPQSRIIRLKDSSIFFKREFFSDETNILIRNSFVIRQAYFFKEDYAAIKTFFDKLYALLNEEILLKKKG